MKSYLERLAALIIVVGSFMGAFAASAFAAGEASPKDGSLIDLARPVYEQVLAGHYLAATALMLVLAVAAAKRYAPGKLGAFMHSDAGGAIATFAMALFGAVATATLGGAKWHWSMLWASVTVAVTAAGGYSMAKKLLEPAMRKWAASHPVLGAILSAILWIFDKPSDAAVTSAESAGDAAVAKDPPTGVDGVLGKPEEL